MAPKPKTSRRIASTVAALVGLWILCAVIISAIALHMSVSAARGSDLVLSDVSSGAARMAESMNERGRSNEEISNAIVAMAKERGMDATVATFPTDGPPERLPERKVPVGFMVGPPGMVTEPNPFDSPTAMIHIPGSMIALRLHDDPLTPIARQYAAEMILLLFVALVVTWLVHERTMRRALAPVATIEAALRGLAAGEYSKLAVVGHEPDEASVVDAYNAAADELATSIRQRAEAESNLRQFVAEAGHELRTPLTVIMGFVDVLRQGAIAEQALAQRILDSVAVEGERMRSLIGNLLLLARLDTVAPDRTETVDLSALVADAVESFRPVAGDTPLTASVEPGVYTTGSASEMREVVGNLLDNALKYAPGANVRATLTRGGRFALIGVDDDGPGMSSALRTRAFDRFSRGDDRSSIPGSGLGLAIVKRIATRSGGDVEIESAPGAGTKVRVRLPIAPVQSESSARSV